MRSTIDTAGRIVVPKAIREKLGLVGGRAIEISERDGRLEIAPVPVEMKLVRRGRGLVAVPSRKLPPLTDEMVRETLERTRR
jgi:AbrB family looped-hinge helix DNA binding protein